MEHYHLILRGKEVFEIVERAQATVRCRPDGEMELHGLEEHFNLAPYGFEVETEIFAKRVDDGTREERKAWISFPYANVLSVTRMPLTEEELDRYKKLKQDSGVSTEPIGFKTSSTD